MSKKQQKSIDEEMLNYLRGETAKERQLHRLHCVALVLCGIPAKEVASTFGDSPRSVAYWVTKFKAKGVDGLADKIYAGRPPTLIPSQMKRVRSFVEAERGKNVSINAARLVEFLKTKFNVSLTIRQCWRILGKINEGTNKR